MKYAIAGIALLGLFVLMVTPIANENNQKTSLAYGSALLVAYDVIGNEKFSQIVHNNIINEGEDFMLEQTFQDGVTVEPDSDQTALGA